MLTRGRGVGSGGGPARQGREGAGCLPCSALRIAPRSGLRRCLPAVACLVFCVCNTCMDVYIYICIYTYKCACIMCVCLGKINLAKGGSGGGERQTGIDSGYLLRAQKTPAEERARGKKKVTLRLHPCLAEGPVAAAAPRRFPPLTAGYGRGRGGERLESFPSCLSVAK